jgi:hypothetical protein
MILKIRRDIYWTSKRMKMRKHIEKLMAFVCSMKPFQQLLFALFWFSSNEETSQPMNFVAALQ